MQEQMFNALVVEEVDGEQFRRSLQKRAIEDLPAGDVLIRVHYSSLNYKDALSATGNRGVTRRFPHTPGIDAAGVVVESDSAELQQGDPVVVIGHDLGMNTSGGFGQYIRVPAEWVVKLPPTLTAREAMCYGTAGFTAAMCVDRISRHPIAVDDGDVLVTGATGGVGSMAVALLAKIGYQVVAATGKVETAADFLSSLGAAEVVARADVTDEGQRPLLRSRWAAVVDSVGGPMLETALRSTKHSAAVTLTGLVASPRLHVTVFPFILRGVTAYGIDSEPVMQAERARLWQLLAGAWKLDVLEQMVREVTLSDLDDEIDRILAGGQTGRVIVNLA